MREVRHDGRVILARAKALGLELPEDPRLAEALARAPDPGRLPPALLQALAAVLAWAWEPPRAVPERKAREEPRRNSAIGDDWC